MVASVPPWLRSSGGSGPADFWSRWTPSSDRAYAVMTAARTATPIRMRGFDRGGFSGFGGEISSSTSGGGDGVGRASVVIGRAREQDRPAGAAVLAGTGPELAGEIQLVGAPRGQMLANPGGRRAANSQVP